MIFPDQSKPAGSRGEATGFRWRRLGEGSRPAGKAPYPPVASSDAAVGRDSKRELDMKQQLKGLILAQYERWRRGLGMQVERAEVFGSPLVANG